MPGIGRDLVVNLAGNNSKLKSTIADSKGGLKSFAASATAFLNPITAGLAAVAGAAIGAGVAVYGLTTNIDKLDKVAKDAARTGVSGKFLQQLTFAADQSGIGLEQLTASVKKLMIAIGRGDDKPFASLGLSIADLAKMNPEQQFLKVADAIGKLPTAAERAAASVKIFGKSGIEMTTLFSSGMDGINKLMERAAELHIGVSAEGLAKVEAANDAIGQMKASFGALLDQITVGLAPAFTMVGTAIADLIPPVTKFFEKFNGLDDKAQWLGDVIVAGMDVGIETIKEHWNTMIIDMVNMAADAAKQIAINMVPGAAIVKWGAENAFGGKVGEKQGGLAAAQGRLDEVLGRLGPEDKGLIRGKLPAMGGKPENVPADGSKLSSLAGGLAESAKGLFDQAALAATSKMTDLKIKGGFLGSVVKNMFGVGAASGDTPAAAKQETKFAGAMQRGSAEAYSTIVQAMSRTKDPNVKATEKQTKELVKAFKKNKAGNFNFVPEFAT